MSANFDSAKKAIADVFEDTSQTPQKTYEELIVLKQHTERLAWAIRHSQPNPDWHDVFDRRSS